ncbi:hypothetical protein HN789_07725 [archaeon]|jgi:hypothetical protein|nr:hypothetical protein [archaeon]MBT4022844.1 hypothetical protein [archaeon]MBT4272962.1 hypothetical protein [archaeon]MBT4460947.1 hypothetical protein [archaeon]MBT4858025.1 hypothetical protein [archaeon]
MKKIMLLSFLIMMITLSAAIAAEIPAINISLMNQDPDPAGPGEYVELRFSIQNTNGGSVAEDFQVELIPGYPFAIDKGESTLKSLGDLPALGPGNNVFVVKFKVRVEDDAIQGNVPVKVRYKHKTISWVSTEYDVQVQTLDSNLAIVSVVSDPDKIKPGDEAVVKIKVKNMADSTLRDVTLKLDLTYSDIIDSLSATTASDKIAAFDSLPFAPIGSATEQKISSLGAGKEYEFEYNLIAFSDAESRIYKIPIELSYYDELETQYVKEDVIGLVVGTKPDLSVIVDESELYVGNKMGTVTIRFINKGFSDVKFLDVILDETEEFEILSAEEVYVGNVDSDDYETVDFELYLTNGATKEEKTIVLPLNVEYRDTNNNLYEEKLELEMKVLSAEKLGIKTSSNGTVMLLLIIVIIVGVVLYRRSRNNKKK